VTVVKPKIGSLFAGIGGFDLGFEREGFNVAWSVEWDRNAQAVLRQRFPNAKVFGDIREVDPDLLERVDVICGGFPCQDLSVAGKRVGLAGERSGLFHDAMRLVRKLKPKILVLENVPGLLSSNNGLDFATVLREVGEGWDCEEVAWRVLDSQFFGVPQKRRRVFIVGSSRIRSAEQVLALSEGGDGDHPKKRATREETSSDTEERARNRGIWWDGGDVSASITTRSHFQSMPDKGNFQAVIEQRVVGALCARDYKGVGFQYVEREKVVVDSRSSFRKISMNVRRLTPRECERLQGFPDDWTQIGMQEKPTADSHRYKQLGNAVTVNVAQWIARRVRMCLHGETA
jgi:DNA (cytosine-5)-methyltransferase 1